MTLSKQEALKLMFTGRHAEPWHQRWEFEDDVTVEDLVVEIRQGPTASDENTLVASSVAARQAGIVVPISIADSDFDSDPKILDWTTTSSTAAHDAGKVYWVEVVAMIDGVLQPLIPWTRWHVAHRIAVPA